MVGFCEAIFGYYFFFLSFLFFFFFFFLFRREKISKRFLVEEIEIAFGLEAPSDRELKERKVAFNSLCCVPRITLDQTIFFSSLGNFSSCRETRGKACIDVITLRYVKLRYP